MSDSVASSLSHFSVFRFTADYWCMSSQDRVRLHSQWISGLRQAASAVHCYQLFLTEALSDVLVWSAVPSETDDAPGHFFDRLARATVPLRQYLEPRTALWGFTRASQYSKSRSRQQIDPFPDDRSPYLVVYPFSKTSEWYLMNREARQEMMNEHIRIGKHYDSIKQLLLYSFGLQDQEFVVVYETDDLSLFSQLVHDLRMTEARRFTLNDTPVHTAIHQSSSEPFSLWR